MQADATNRSVVTFDASNSKGAYVKDFGATGKPGYPVKGFNPEKGSSHSVVAREDKHNFYWLVPAQ
jgi:hypothetical protein